MSFLYPEALVLAIPIFLCWWRIARSREVGRSRWRSGAFVSAGVLAFLLLALAGPCRVIESEGADVIMVIDRSASLPPGAADTLKKLSQLAGTKRGPGDRLGVVTFGRRAVIEQLPEEKGVPGAFVRDVGSSASDIDAALRRALSLIPKNRPGRIFLLSDGEATGASPLGAAREAAARGIPIDTRHFERPDTLDIAVEKIELPGLILPGEAFQFSAFLVASEASQIDYRLSRGERVLEARRITLAPGRNQLIFYDQLQRVGVHSYVLSIESGSDRVPENDVGRGVCEVVGRRAVLLVNRGGIRGRFAQALASGDRELVVQDVEEFNPSLDSLARFGLVVFDDVPATAIKRRQLKTLARHIEDAGAGFLLTGGRHSFGLGGYHSSPLAPLLPVSFEIKDEDRKLRLALVIALDRSGSMNRLTAGGETKISLASRGTIEAIGLLSGRDEVAVLVVDTSAHRIQKLRAIAKSPKLIAKVADIGSRGGGIYVDAALQAASRELAATDADRKHILLFTDANDSEQPGDYPNLIKELRRRDITISVIALGTEEDKDAALLMEIATLGGGGIHFTQDAEELPQLFAQEAVTRAGASFIEGRVRPLSLPQLQALATTETRLPPIDGYNLSYIKDGAAMGIRSDDDLAAPILAFWRRGLGRVASFAAPTEGKAVSKLTTWPGYDAFFTTLAEWLIAAAPPAGLAARLEREGHTVRATVEIDPETPEDLPDETPLLIVSSDLPDVPTRQIPMVWESEFQLGASFRIDEGRTLHTRLVIGKKSQHLPPITLPYSPEFEPRLGREEGRATLASLSALSGGKERLALDGLFDTQAPTRGFRPLALLFVLLALILALLEIAMRRLALFQGGRWLLSRPARRKRAKAAPGEKPGGAPASTEERAAQAPKEDPLRALDRAKRRADRRMGRD